MRQRRRRTYALYELHLSTHDEAKPQDLEDMVEAIANVVRAFPGERARNGQPFVALELLCGAGQDAMEWSISVRCEPALAARWTPRSAPPTPTCASAAATPRPRRPAPARCAWRPP